MFTKAEKASAGLGVDGGLIMQLRAPATNTHGEQEAHGLAGPRRVKHCGTRREARHPGHAAWTTPGTTGTGVADFLDDPGSVWYGFGAERTEGGTPAFQGYLTLQEASPVPLPASFWLFASGLLLFPLARKPRRLRAPLL